MTSSGGRTTAIVDATFAITSLADAHRVPLPLDIARLIATTAIDAALPVLEQDWRQHDAELAARTLTAIGEAIAIVESVRPRALPPPTR